MNGSARIKTALFWLFAFAFLVLLYGIACSSIEPLRANQANIRMPGPPKDLKAIDSIGALNF
jgi:hypothetical protein